jgi:hypothetical protein
LQHNSPGALHMHTNYSDGTGTVEELARAAKQAGLQWIIITDHDDLRAAPAAGWLHDVLVIVGHEITPDRNHFLALNINEVIDNTLSPQQFVDQVYERGGFGIIAHPDEQVANDFKDIYRWDDWNVDGPSQRNGQPVGIELWNFMSDWGESLTPRNKELLYFLPKLALNGPTAPTLAWWDELNMAGKRTFGVGGVDAHAFKKRAPWGELEVFSYRWIFGTLVNYAQLDAPLNRDPHIATQQVYDALGAGKSYFINRIDGDSPNLEFVLERQGQRWNCGDSPSLADGPLNVLADVGLNADVHLIHNGRLLVRGQRQIRHSIMQPGVYRLEGYRKGRPWLYSNPIYVQP